MLSSQFQLFKSGIKTEPDQDQLYHLTICMTYRLTDIDLPLKRVVLLVQN